MRIIARNSNNELGIETRAKFSGNAWIVPMVEKRTKPRRDVQVDAIIVDMAGALLGRCKLIDVSESGAKLIQLEPTDAPDKFNLVLTRDGTIRRRCEVAWRSERDLGVRFVKSESIEGRTKHNKIDK